MPAAASFAVRIAIPANPLPTSDVAAELAADSTSSAATPTAQSAATAAAHAQSTTTIDATV